MPLALTVFGIGTNKTASICYAFLRDIRGRTPYPPPSLPAQAKSNLGTKYLVKKTSIHLWVWSKVFDTAEQVSILAELDSGHLTIPADCPISTGVTLNGTPFPDIQIEEKCNRLPIEGVGALWTKGFNATGVTEAVIASIQAICQKQEVGAEVQLVMGAIDAEACLKPLVTSSRRLGTVDYLYRSSVGSGFVMFNIHIEKPPPNSSDPVTEVTVSRVAAPLEKGFQIHAVLYSWRNIVESRLMSLPAGKREVQFAAPTHVTGAKFVAFNADTGALADQFEVAWTQSIDLGITAQTGKDLLPKPVRGASTTKDLEERPRISTSPATSIVAGDRAAGIDSLRHSRERYDNLIGKPEWRGRCHWFASGVEPQVEVIRWMKEQFEKPNLSKAYIIDPYLGTEALKRIIVRQGNESIFLNILISPGDIDPDAPDLETKDDSGTYFSSIAHVAGELADRLCGSIKIINIRRGEGKTQAFHDRFLVLVDRSEVPCVYLLSNSLSKAAGHWPFTAVELDRITSWTAFAYVKQLLQGRDGDRELSTETIWESAREPSIGESRPTPNTNPIPSADAELVLSGILWRTYLKLHEMDSQPHLSSPAAITKATETLVVQLSKMTNAPSDLAALVVGGVHGRDQLAVVISDELKKHPTLMLIASEIDAAVAQRVLTRLAPEDKRPTQAPALERLEVLRRTGQSISGQTDATTFVRNNLNPSIEHYTFTLEYGLSSNGSNPHDLLYAGLGLIVLGMQIGLLAKSASTTHRQGLASDYVNFLGRLLRSATADIFLSEPTASGPDYGLKIVQEAAKLSQELHKVFGADLDEPIARLRSDTFIPTRIEAMFKTTVPAPPK